MPSSSLLFSFSSSYAWLPVSGPTLWSWARGGYAPVRSEMHYFFVEGTSVMVICVTSTFVWWALLCGCHFCNGHLYCRAVDSSIFLIESLLDCYDFLKVCWIVIIFESLLDGYDFLKVFQGGLIQVRASRIPGGTIQNRFPNQYSIQSSRQCVD